MKGYESKITQRMGDDVIKIEIKTNSRKLYEEISKELDIILKKIMVAKLEKKNNEQQPTETR